MRFVLVLVSLVLFTLSAPVFAQAYDPTAPCGRDENGVAYACAAVDANMLEATCTTTASPYYCLPYHQRACQTGFALACQMAQLGANCQGGDPNQCQYYVDILRANSACALNGDPNACGWLRQQGL